MFRKKREIRFRKRRKYPDAWITTVTGRKYWPLEPAPKDVCLTDIAHALSLECRYGNHCLTHYSVAQHSVLVSRIVPTLGALLHDAHEAYITDVMGPIKPYLKSFEKYARLNDEVIAAAFGIKASEFRTREVKEADLVMLKTEMRTLMPIEAYESIDAKPLARDVHPWPANEARIRFTQRFYELFNER